MVTSEQRRLLQATREHIEKHPETYLQTCWGDGRPNCRTLGCVAGHMVAANPELRAEVDSCRAAGSSAVLVVATEALGLPGTPPLFGITWPEAWFASANAPDAAKGDASPTAEQATAVLNAVIDGRITDALTQAP